MSEPEATPAASEEEAAVISPPAPEAEAVVGTDAGETGTYFLDQFQNFR